MGAKPTTSALQVCCTTVAAIGILGIYIHAQDLTRGVSASTTRPWQRTWDIIFDLWHHVCELQEKAVNQFFIQFHFPLSWSFLIYNLNYKYLPLCFASLCCLNIVFFIAFKHKCCLGYAIKLFPLFKQIITATYRQANSIRLKSVQ